MRNWQWQAWLGVCLAGMCGVGSAAVLPYQEYSQKVRDAQQLSALDDGLFGDTVSLFNGGTEFNVVDVSLPGNDALPVELRRRLNVVAEPSVGFVDRFGGVGNWDIDVPNISGVVDGHFRWNSNSLGEARQRCADRLYPSTGSQARLSDIFHGFTIRIPGADSKSLLAHETSTYPKLGTGTAGLWTTRDLDAFTCTPMINGYPGDGFVMHAANGIRYFFDVGVERSIDAVQGRNNTRRTRVQVFLLASRIEDRFGNSVSYTYDGDGYPVRIAGSDGREISLVYSQGKLVQATVNGRQWQYGYNGEALGTVTLPDQSRWTYSYSGSLRPLYEFWDAEQGPTCSNYPTVTEASFALDATHPSGAQGHFEFRHLRHGRSGVRRSVCVIDVPGTGGEPGTYYLGVPYYYDMFSLVSKTLSGPGLDTPLTWQYRYGSGRYGLWGTGVPTPNTPCTDRSVCSLGKTTSILQPDGTRDLYRYGMQYGINEGVLLGKRRVTVDGQVAREETYDYVSDDDMAGMPFSGRYGALWGGNDVFSVHARPLKRTTLTQDGFISNADPDAPPSAARSSTAAEQAPCQGESCELYFNVPQQTTAASMASQGAADAYVEEVLTFDSYARPLTYRRYNSLGYSKVETQAYYDHLGHWVLGQPLRSTTDGVETQRTEFDAASALPVHDFSFGQRTRSLGYNGNGTVASITDGNGRVTGLESWYRGSPQVIRHPDATALSASIDGNGWVHSTTDENGYTTSYGYDAMGRITAIAYPDADDVAWSNVTARFEQVNAAEEGLGAGHWRHVVRQGNQEKVTYFDAFWRPVVERAEDSANAASTRTWRARRYDSYGRQIFESYPRNPFVDGALPFNAAMPGSWTVFDTLGRPVETRQDSELGTLTTRTDYLAELVTRSTNPRNQTTVTSHQAYHQPGYKEPRDISLPEGVFMDIGRDVFGRITSLRRRNADGGQTALRRYVYDAHGRLCKRIEPEEGSTVTEYDGNGNTIWTATGLELADGASCNRAEAYASGRRVDRAYDVRDRITTLVFPDGQGNQSFSYWPDGLARSVTTRNDLTGNQWATNTYSYNKRRLLKSETLERPGIPVLAIGYGYDANGNLASHGLPSGRVLSYTPNALGQPTGVFEQTQGRAIATAVAYHPNGSIKSFNFANGITHAVTLNGRKLPERRNDTGVLDTFTAYDAAGNPVQIRDDLRGTHYGRSMRYDGLDRLIEASSCSFGGDCVHRYSYDALDNIASWQLGGVKQHFYWYDSRNRLTNIRNEVGSAVIGLSYDAQGNLSTKNGQAFVFDFGNRMRSATGKESYQYDSQGRRVASVDANGAEIRSFYGLDGVLRRTEDLRKGEDTEYAYLGGQLIANLISTRTPSTPVPPTLQVPDYSNNGTYTVSWSSSAGATTYELQERRDLADWQAAYTGSATSHVISGRLNGTYGYRVRGCGASCGSWSPIRTTAVALPPADPVLLSAPSYVVGGNYVIGWNAVNGASEYELEERFNNGAWQPVYAGAALSHSVSGKPGGQYGYRAQACNPAGCGPYSDTRSVEVLGVPLSAPTLNLPAYSSTGNFSVAWSAVASAASYDLEQQYNGGAWVRAYFDAQTAVNLTGRATGMYRFRVKACNAAGCGPSSAEGAMEVLTPPLAPGISAPANSNSPNFTVSWSASATATAYVLEESANGAGWTQIYSGPATASAVLGRGNGSYAYRVRACNGSGCGGYSGTAGTTVFLPPPVPTITGSVRFGAPRINCVVNWTKTATATSYDLMAATTGVIQYSGPDNKYSHVTRACAPSHVVRACNSAGCSEWSNPPTPQVFESGN